MTDVQILTLALAVIVPLSLLIYSNSRITDVRVAIQASLLDMKETLRAEMRAEHVEQMGLLNAVMGKLDEMDRRLTTLEGKR